MSWWKKSVVYQIYPISFKDSNSDGKGDLKGIIEKVDYLKKLGVEIIWLTPIYKSPMKDNGYDISDYYNINEMFGTMEDFHALLKKIHDNGMKLIMDLVVNHCSSEHFWFLEAIKNKNSKYRDYFYFSDTKLTNQKGFFSEDCWTYNEEAKAFYYHLFAKEQPDLNWDNEEMRMEVYKNINWWLDKGVDGFRLDVIDLVGKSPENENIDVEKSHKYIHEMYVNCFKGRDVFTVGETPFADTENAVKYSNPQSEELSMVFGFEHVQLDEINFDKWKLKKLNLLDLKKCFTKWQNALDEKGWNSLFWNNHDQPRIVSRFGNDKEYRVESGKMLAILLHGLKGTPYIYQGEEIGMTNVKMSFEDLRDVETFNMIKDKKAQNWSDEKIFNSINVKGRDNARTPFQWNNEKYAGFSNTLPWIKVNPNFNEINVENALENEKSIFYTYKNLIELRKKYNVLVDGKYEILFSENEKVYAYKRILGDENIFVICNFTGENVKVDFNEKYSEILAHNYDDFKMENGVVSLKAYEAVMLYSN